MTASERAVRVLNQLLVTDRDAIRRLLACSVRVSPPTAAHATVQVTDDGELLEGFPTFTLRPMGLINAILPASGDLVAAVTPDGSWESVTHFALAERDGRIIGSLRPPYPLEQGPAREGSDPAVLSS